MGKKVSARLPRRSARRIAAAESRRTFLQSLEVIRLDRELVLDGLQGRHRGPCPLARVRRARSEWRPGWLYREQKHGASQRGGDFKFSRATSASSSLVSHTPRAAFARGRARVGACSTPSTCSRQRARWVRYGYAAPGRCASRPRRARVSPSPRSFPFSTLLRPNALTSPPRRAFADPGAPAEPRGSPESAQVRQALRGGRVQHHHEAALSAGTSSPARRKTSLRYDP